MSDTLNDRHLTVMQSLAQGKNIEQIAGDLKMSRRMIDIYIMQAKERLSAKTSVEAVVKAMKSGYIDV